MAPNSIPKLSLVAQYDDLCRYTKLLTEGCEKEFKQYVENQKRLYQERKKADNEIEMLRKKVASLECEKQTFETKLAHMRKVLMAEVEQRKKMENEKAAMQRQIELIKDVLLGDGNTIDNETKEKFFMLSSACKTQVASPYKLTTIEESVGSLLSSSDCDQSDTETSNGITRRKRRSRSKKFSGDLSIKKRKSEERKRYFFEDELNLDEEITVPKRVVNFRSTSELHTNTPETITPRPVFRSESEQVKRIQKYNTIGYGGDTPLKNFGSGKNYTGSHNFAKKTIIKPEKCYPCGKSMKSLREGLRCVNCRIVSHIECQNKCPEYCIHASATPTGGLTGLISDYTPSTPPMIPPLIAHCVNQIESRGLNTVGLYRESGSKKEVKHLVDEFAKGKNVPPLNDVDVHVLCGTIKSFLRSLKETLITTAGWKKFVEAADCAGDDLVFDAVCDLPQPNRDTLAFLILHLQRIVERKEDCKMSAENIAKVLGPTIVGYSKADSPESNLPDALLETRQQYKVMEKLLKIPADYWRNLLGEDNNIYAKVMRTPECTPAPITSRLGPISSDHRSRSTTPTRTTPLSRVTKTKMSKRMFLSPLLK